MIALLLALFLQFADDDIALRYVVPTYQAVLYLYEAEPGAEVRLNTCEVLSSGSWFGPRPDETVILTRATAHGYSAPLVYRAVVPVSGRLYLKASSPETLKAGRVLVSLDSGANWQAMAGPECRNTIILPLVMNGGGL